MSQAAAAQPYQRHTQRGGLQVMPDLWSDTELAYATRSGVHDQQQPDNNLRRLYSAGGFRAAWTQYQQAILNGLNQRIAEGTYPTETKQIALQTARNPAEAAIFNHASMAFNNHFYFQSISTSPDRDMDPRLKDALVKDFGSLENLRSEMLAMGEAMFGPGFVWLVRVPSSAGSVGKEFKLLNTYLAGSPFAGAHNRRQAIDMNTQNVANAVAAGGVEGLARGATLLQHQTPQNNVGAFGQHSRLNAAENVALGGVDVLPCLCVSTWEHSYMLDWRYEKRNFLERWWTFINWDVVRQRSGVENDSQQSRQTTYEKARGQTSYGRR